MGADSGAAAGLQCPNGVWLLPSLCAWCRKAGAGLAHITSDAYCAVPCTALPQGSCCGSCVWVSGPALIPLPWHVASCMPCVALLHALSHTGSHLPLPHRSQCREAPAPPGRAPAPARPAGVPSRGGGAVHALRRAAAAGAAHRAPAGGAAAAAGARGGGRSERCRASRRGAGGEPVRCAVPPCTQSTFSLFRSWFSAALANGCMRASAVDVDANSMLLSPHLI